MRKILLAFLISGWISSSPEVYFIEPKNGDVVSNTFTVKFGLSNFGIAPAGYDIPMTGHHHLLINVDLPEDLSQPIAADKNHIHHSLFFFHNFFLFPLFGHLLHLTKTK